MKSESGNTVYKRIVTDDIYKSVIAFANTSGGTIYVSVDDNSEAVGIRRIFTLYADCHDKPKIEIPSNTFKIILPKRTRNSD